MALCGCGPTRSIASAMSWVLLIVAAGSLSASAAAKPPRFAISVSGSDRQDWTVGNSGGACTRYGNGSQTVRFASKRSVLASISERRRFPGEPAGLYFTGHGPAGYSIDMDGTGTVTREDGTVYAPPDPGSPPCTVAAKDCGVRALDNLHNYRGDFSDGVGSFQLTVGNAGRHMVLESQYWESEESAFRNCLALRTPEGCCADEPPFWRGPTFGDQLYEGDAMTARLAPLALRRGRVYRFRATEHFTLLVDSAPINSPIGHGRFVMLSSGIPSSETGSGDGLGSPRSVTHRIAWVITLRRVA